MDSEESNLLEGTSSLHFIHVAGEAGGSLCGSLVFILLWIKHFTPGKGILVLMSQM